MTVLSFKMTEQNRQMIYGTAFAYVNVAVAKKVFF